LGGLRPAPYAHASNPIHTNRERAARHWWIEVIGDPGTTFNLTQS
jgi:hypothetical protein